MKIPWTLYLAWKQLFPSKKKVSFFSMLAVIGVALGVNVMIVVIVFMQGFQEKFRKDIIDAQGHGRIIPWKSQKKWICQQKQIEDHNAITAVMPYIQGQLLLQKGEFHSIPFSMGIDPNSGNSVLQVDSFLKEGFLKMNANDAQDITPVPTIETLEDEVVFVSSQVARRLGVRPPSIIRFNDQNISEGVGMVNVLRLDPFVESAEWEIIFQNDSEFIISSDVLADQILINLTDDPKEMDLGIPVFQAVPGSRPFKKGDRFKFHVFKNNT